MISDSTSMVHLTHWFMFITVYMIKGFPHHYHRWIQKMEIKKKKITQRKKNQHNNFFFFLHLKLRCKLKVSSGMRTISASALTVRHVVLPSTFFGGNQEKSKPRKSWAGCSPAVCCAINWAYTPNSFTHWSDTSQTLATFVTCMSDQIIQIIIILQFALK